jgi:ubiquinone/menaquinone biosynthesis C-methylase UbiE
MEPHQLEIRDQQKASWNAFSPGWKKWDALTMGFLKVQGEEIINALELSPDDKVLDIATGTGEPGLTMASIVERGSVTGVYLSEKILEIAQQKADNQGLVNFSTKTADISQLPFDDSTFDAVSWDLCFSRI